MELKDFVRETLLNIVQGVKEAQNVCSVEASKSNKQEEGNKAQTCIKFSVPVILPSIDNGEIEIPRVARSTGSR